MSGYAKPRNMPMGPPLSLQETPLHWNVSATVGFAALAKPGSLATKNTRGPNLGDVTNVINQWYFPRFAPMFRMFSSLEWDFHLEFPWISPSFRGLSGPNASWSFTSQWPLLSSWTWCVTDSHHTSVQWFQYFTQRPGKAADFSWVSEWRDFP